MPDTGWASAENARRYADFTAKFPMYHQTSRDLASRLELESASLVVDLACGTGATTEVLLETLPADAGVVAIDGSEAMQAIARQRISDQRVSWVVSRMESFDTALDGHARVDAVVCNSAIWQADLPAAFAAVRNVLRPGGRFAFNVGSRFVRLDEPAGEAERSAASTLFELMRDTAASDYGFVPPPPSGPRIPRPTVEEFGELLAAAGLRMERREVLEYEDSAEADYAWLQVPVFTEWGFRCAAVRAADGRARQGVRPPSGARGDRRPGREPHALARGRRQGGGMKTGRGGRRCGAVRLARWG